MSDDARSKYSLKTDWIEMFPFGVVMGANQMRPVMVFKDKAERRVLPVWLTHIDAGIMLVQGQGSFIQEGAVVGTPHDVSMKILNELNLRVEKCLFKTMKNKKQWIEIHIQSLTPAENKSKTAQKAFVIEAPAEDAISYCLRAGCRFYATIDYIEKSRVLEGEIGITGGLTAQNLNPHPYIN